MNGVHDDVANCPDAELPWTYPAQPINSAALGHVGMSPTGAMEGTTMHGMWSDSDRTIPITHGTMARSQIEKGESGDRSQAQQDPQLMNDLPWNARGTQKMGVDGETNMGKDFIQQIGQKIYDKAEDGSQDQNLKYPKPQSSQKKTIGDQTFQGSQKVLNLIKQVDPQNGSGAIQKALPVMTGLKNLTSGGSSGLGGGGFSSLFNAAVQAMSGQGGGQGGGSSGGAGQGGGGGSLDGSGAIDLGGQSTAGLPTDPMAIVTALLTDASSLPVGPGTSLESYVSTVVGPAISTAANDPTNQNLLQPILNIDGTLANTANVANTANTANTPSPTPQQQATSQAASAIASMLNSAFSGQGDQDGLGSFSKEQGVIKSMEGIFKQLQGGGGGGGSGGGGSSGGGGQ